MLCWIKAGKHEYILYDSTHMKVENRQNQSMMIEVRILVTSGGVQYCLRRNKRELSKVLEMSDVKIVEHYSKDLCALLYVVSW